FNRETSQLIVRQTRDQMELVEALIDSLDSEPEKQIHLVYQIIDSKRPLFTVPATANDNMRKTETVDPDSGARGANAHSLSVQTLQIVDRLTLNPERYQEFVGRVEKEKLGDLRRAPSIISRSGSRVEMWVADALTKIDPVIGADEFSIDLSLNLITGRPDEPPKAEGTFQLTILNGQTAVSVEKLKNGGYRTRLLTATLVDPAGLPIAAAREPAAAPELLTKTYVMTSEELAPSDNPSTPHSAEKALEDRGVTFGPGAKATFNKVDGTLIVRNSPEELAMVEAIVDELKRPKKQIFFTIREVTMDAPKAGDPFAFLLPDVATTSPKRNNDGIDGVLTDPQFQVMIRALSKRKDVEILSMPSVLTRQGQPGVIEAKDRRWGVRGVVGADGFTIDVDFFLPKKGETWLEKGKVVLPPTGSVTIWDGQTIVWSEPLDGGKRVRVIFIGSQMVDAAGMSVNPPKVELPEKPADSEPDLTAAQQDAVKKADEFALRGSQLIADDDLVGAELAFIESLRNLPDHSIVKERRDAYLKQLLRVWEKLRTDLQEEKNGNIDQLLEEAVPSLFPEKTIESANRHDLHPPPSDLWFGAYTRLREGLEQEERGENSKAQESFRQAMLLFTALKEKHPDFYPQLVNYRLEQIINRLAEENPISPAK
ncbi:MAG: hypothetical protein KDN20_13180, partial [Verrucomicrobiae bacterium]|nr:hypothetical protein [Verrucomicrobiae bacterium]